MRFAIRLMIELTNEDEVNPSIKNNLRGWESKKKIDFEGIYTAAINASLKLRMRPMGEEGGLVVNISKNFLGVKS